MITPKTEQVSELEAIRRSLGWLLGVLLSLGVLFAVYVQLWMGPSTSRIGPSGGEMTYVLLKTMTVTAEDFLTPDMRAEWWSNNKHPGEFPRQAAMLTELAEAKPSGYFCQLGFRAGHSSALYLTAQENATLYVFDEFELPYSIRQMSLLTRIYHPRMHFLRGRSLNTLPWFRDNYKNVTCDFFAVDANPAEDIAMSDFLNAIKVTKVGGQLIANEINQDSPGFATAWEKLVRSGYIKGSTCDSEVWAEGKNRTWCHGEVAKQQGKLEALILTGDGQNLVMDKYFVL